MRKCRFLRPVLLCMFLTAFAGNAAAAARPEGTCTPPGSWANFTEAGTTIVRAWGAFFPPTGKFYAVGGRFDDTAGDDFTNVNIYDPATDAWSTSTATFSDNQVNNMVGGVLDFGGTQYIVAVGGSAAGATTSSAEVRQYDPVADTMTTLTNDAWPGVGAGNTILPGGAAVYENKLFVFGGFDIGTGMVDTIWQFDPSAAEGSRWTQMTAVLPTAIGYIPTATSGDLIYLLGGSEWDAGGATIFDSAETSVYDPDTDTITPITPIPRVVAETRAVTQTDGTIWVLGGGRTAPNPNNEVDIYDPVGDAWSLGPPFVSARRNMASDIDPATGSIWVVGGYDTDGTTPLSVSETFTACVPVDDTIFADGFDPPI